MEAKWNVSHLSYYGLEFDIPYKIANATLRDIDLDIANDKLVVTLEGDRSGNHGRITLQISKNLIWSDFLNNHQYRVYIDGIEATGDYAPEYLTEASCFEEISIAFPATSQRIEIMSRFAQPTPRNLASGGFIATDNACYKQGDIITVFGQAPPTIQPLLLITPRGTDYFPPIKFSSKEDGSFIARFVIEGENATVGVYALQGNFPRVWNGSYAEKPDVRFTLLTRNYEDFTVGKSVLVEQLAYDRYSPISWANTTEFYFINTQVLNDSNEPKTFAYLTMVLDKDGITQNIQSGNLEVLPRQRTDAGAGYYYWMPEKAGDYVIKVFIWTGLENPEPILDPPNVINVTVKDKIAILSQGERDGGLYVKRINLAAQTVTVSNAVCAPTPVEDERTLHAGAKVEISSYAVAYFLGFSDNGKAIFKYESTGRGPCMLVCHHEDPLEAYRAHIQILTSKDNS